MEMRTALVLGTSGPVGRYCLEELLADDGYERVVSVDWRPLEHVYEQVTHHVAGSDDWWDRNAGLLQGHDIFCCPHATMRDAGDAASLYRMGYTCPSKAARIALKNGARSYLFVSTLEADPDSNFLFLRMKGEMEAFVRALSYESVHLFRAPLVVATEEEVQRLQLAEALESVSYAFVGALREERPVAASTLARSMVRAARRATDGGVHTYDPSAIRRLASGGAISLGVPPPPAPGSPRPTAP